MQEDSDLKHSYRLAELASHFLSGNFDRRGPAENQLSFFGAITVAKEAIQ